MLRPIQVLRLAGLATCLLSAAISVMELLYSADRQRAFGNLVEMLGARLGWSRSWIAFDEAAVVLCFATLYWATTSLGRRSRSLSAVLVLLGSQMILSVAVAPELLLLCSFEAALVLGGGLGWIWLLLQFAVQTGCFYLQTAMTGDNPILHIMTPGPRNVATSMAIISVSALVWHFLAYSLGLVGATESRQARELALVNAELRATREMEREAVKLAERLHLSRELHDSSGHHLAALSVNLRLLRKLDDRAESEQKVEESLIIVQRLLADVRGVVRDLRQIPPMQLRPALETLARGAYGLRVHLEFDPDPPELKTPFQAHALFRCAQELITNALKHSDARNLWIGVESGDDGVRLRGRDDGRGAELIRFGNGLRGIEERTSELGGEMHVRTRRGKGFEVEVTLPARSDAA